MLTFEIKVRDLAAKLVSQRQWIAEHGGNLAGYIALYGSANDLNHHGDGGEAIFEADMGELHRLESLARRIR